MSDEDAAEKAFKAVPWEFVNNMSFHDCYINAFRAGAKYGREGVSNVYYNNSKDWMEIFIKDPTQKYSLTERLFIGPGLGIDLSVTPLSRTKK